MLEQLPVVPSSIATDEPIASIDDAGPWPDFIEIRFRARPEGTVYKLSVDTYHGAGGAWGPE